MSGAPSDYAVITLTEPDTRFPDGRTVCAFIKEKPDSPWTVAASKPLSLKGLRHKTHARDIPPDALTTMPDGRQRIDLPGISIPWNDNARAALDRLHAELGNTNITVDQFRFCLTRQH